MDACLYCIHYSENPAQAAQSYKGNLPLGGPSRSVLGPLGAPRAPEDLDSGENDAGGAPDHFALGSASNGGTATCFRPDLIFSGLFFLEI